MGDRLAVGPDRLVRRHRVGPGVEEYIRIFGPELKMGLHSGAVQIIEKGPDRPCQPPVNIPFRWLP